MAHRSWFGRVGAVLTLTALAAGCGSEVTSSTGTGSGGSGEGGAGTSTSSSGEATTSASSVSTSSATSSTSTSSGPPPTWADCTTQGSCVLAANTCCGVCGMPTLSDVDAVNSGDLDEHFAAVCPDPSGPCPGCASEPNPNLFAYCDLSSGLCAKDELTRSPYAECSGPDDCKLRLSLECCECGASGEWVAVTAVKEVELEALLCPPDVACAKCQPVPPVDIAAGCVDGFCAVVSAP